MSPIGDCPPDVLYLPAPDGSGPLAEQLDELCRSLELIRAIDVEEKPDIIVVANDGLIVGASSDQTLRTWDARTGGSGARMSISKDHLDANRPRFAVGGLALLADGRHVLVSYGCGMFVCDLEGTSDPVRLTDSWVYSLDVLPDDSRAVTGLQSGKVQHWNSQPRAETPVRRVGRHRKSPSRRRKSSSR